MQTVKFDSKIHERDRFDCEDETINRYLKTQANQDQKRGISQVHILPDLASGIAGFYTLHANRIIITDLPDNLIKQFGNRAELPVFELGRLGVDKRFAGKGIGRWLIREAMEATVNNAVGAVGLIVIAKTEKNVLLYESLGFIRLGENDMRLFIDSRTIRLALT